ncbi:flavodoxin [Bacillus coahuilensis m2-6]|uniref:flavodoxin n=1 Tax=Bacillus coahuilensis TaxID=408580 RepID=UPI0001850ABB|nr:flavodoxin [Bacillus coahuilensis]KUP09277.1 flavodoxin [Bacillus coahuilensis m2-6]
MKAFIGYASMSGNTEDIASILYKSLERNGYEVHKEELDTVDAVSLLEYDLIFIGAYTWGDGDLPYEVEDFYEELQDVMYEGKIVGCFGSGDRSYPKFCAAVDLLANKFAAQKAEVFPTLLKIEGNPMDENQEQECTEYIESILQWRSENRHAS